MPVSEYSNEHYNLGATLMNTSSTLLGTVGTPISSRVKDWRLLLIVRATFLAGLVLFVTGSLLGMSLGYQLDLVTLIPILSQANFGIPPQSLVNVLFAVEEISVFVFLIGGLFI